MSRIRPIAACAAFVVCALAWLGIAASAAQAQTMLSVDDDIRTSERGWAIGFSNWAAGCVASGTYGGGTTLWLGISAKYGEFVAFTNPDWQSIEARRSYRIEVKTRGYGNWRGDFPTFRLFSIIWAVRT